MSRKPIVPTGTSKEPAKGESKSGTTSVKRPYQWPPPPEPYVPVRKNPVHSVITALPVIMLLAGLYLFYRQEGAETGGEALLAQSVEVDGAFEGLSSVTSGGDGRHYLWFISEERRRGPRVTAEQARALEVLMKGDRLTVSMAPHVDGSRTLWAWKVLRGSELIFD